MFNENQTIKSQIPCEYLLLLMNTLGSNDKNPNQKYVASRQ